MQGRRQAARAAAATRPATYRGAAARPAAAALGEINVTPLVDVVLVLLLVFMVTAPMMSRGIDVSLPVANQPQIDPEDRITVSVNARRADLHGRQARQRRCCSRTSSEGMMEGRPAKVVYLRADEGLRYGKVIAVVDKHQEGGRGPDRLRVRAAAGEGARVNDAVDR